MAWACVLLGSRAILSDDVFSTADEAPCWRIYQLKRIGSVRYISELQYVDVELWDSSGHLIAPARPSMVPSWSGARDPSRLLTPNDYIKPGPNDRIVDVIVEDACGLPWHALHCEHQLFMSSDGATLVVGAIAGGAALDLGDQTPQMKGSVEIRPRFWYSSAIPFIPIWPAFAINTMFYAAILWMLCAAPMRVRRWRRIKRGQCASCGYSLRENVSDKCPECGALTEAAAYDSINRPAARSLSSSMPGVRIDNP